MLFVKNNDDVVYVNHYSGLLEVEGKGVLGPAETDVWPVSDANWGSEFNTLSVQEGITGLAEGYLDAFPNIGCLILGRTVGSVALTPAVQKRLRKYKVLIRGEYDSYAETFAKELGLKFLQSDIHLADDDDEVHHEHDIITLRFHPNGSADIHYDCYTPGSSAGNFGGGEVVREIPRDFYVGCDVESFAANFPEKLREQLTANEMLGRFLEAANRRHEAKKRHAEKTDGSPEEIRLELRDEEWPLESIDHDREIVRAIVTDDDGWFYFVRAERDDHFGKATLIETSGGGVEPGEDLETAIRRELKEELGADVDIVCKIGVVSDYYNLIRRHNINNYFLCRAKSFGETHLTDQEIEDYHLRTLKLRYDDALDEYKKRSDTRIGRLIANREIPILLRAKELLDGGKRMNGSRQSDRSGS